MNLKAWMAAMLMAAFLPTGPAAAAADTGVAGKWSTEAGRYLSIRKDAEINASIRDVPIFDAAGGLRGNGNGRGGGTGNMGRGNAQGRGNVGGGRGGQAGLGNSGAFGGNNGLGTGRGNNGAFGNNGRGNSGAFGNNGLGNNGAFGNNGLGNNGAFGNNGLGNNGLGPSGGAFRLGALNIPEGRSFTMELKVDKKNKITGSLVAWDYDGEVKEEKLKIEDGLLTGAAFTFSTTRKINSIKVPYKWKGEQTAPNTIRLTIISPSSQPAGEQESIVFRREQ